MEDWQCDDNGIRPYRATGKKAQIWFVNGSSVHRPTRALTQEKSGSRWPEVAEYHKITPVSATLCRKLGPGSFFRGRQLRNVDIEVPNGFGSNKSC
jgi:hypothetical protein